MNIFSLLAHSAARRSQYPALFLGYDQLATYGELENRSKRLANGMAHHGVSGERVVIIAANCPEYLEILFGTWGAGGAVVPVNYKLHPREIRQIVKDADPAIVFAGPDVIEPIIQECGEILPGKVIAIGDDRYQNLVRNEPAEPADVAPNALAWLFYTSGTTGPSKGAMLTHRNLMAMQIAHLADFENIGSDRSLIHAAPMSHASGLYALPYIARGARQIIPASRRFDAAEVLDLCGTHPGCGIFLAPTMVRRLCEIAEKRGAVPSGLRTILYGGAPMYRTDLHRAVGIFGDRLIQLYGQGEAPLTITGLRREEHNIGNDRVSSSVGWPRSGVEVMIVDADGCPLPAGETGEVVCRGDVVMAGYWRNPDASADALRHGWLRTGDTGAMDADGLLTLSDRAKDVIISGGSNIYPREIEEVLLRHPAIAEASVVGERDAEWGEIVVAYIVISKQVTGSELDEHCLANIARFKRPKRYLFVDELPKNAYGKILKRELTKQL